MDTKQNSKRGELEFNDMYCHDYDYPQPSFLHILVLEKVFWILQPLEKVLKKLLILYEVFRKLLRTSRIL